MIVANEYRYRKIRYTYLFLSLLNLIIAALFCWLATRRTLFDPILIRGKLKINSFLHVHPHSDVGSTITMLALSVLGASLLWVGLRMLPENLSKGQIFCFVSASINLVAAPMTWVYVFHPPWFPLSGEQAGFLPIEFATVVIFAALYVNRSWALPVWAILAAIGAHYGLWFWIFRERGGPSMLTMLVTGLCASLLWTIFAQQRGHSLAANTPLHSRSGDS
jgi:hypothetical protein